MNHLGAEHQAQEKAELDAARRRALIGKIFKGTLTLAALAVVVLAFVYRAEVGQKLHQLTGKAAAEGGAATAEGANFNENARKKFGSNLNDVRDFAKERDQLLEEFSGK